MSVGRKYKAMWKLLATTQYESPFEITKDVKKFIQEYSLSKDFDKKKIDGQEEGKLKKEVAARLLKTSTLFIHENTNKETNIEAVRNGIRDHVLTLFDGKAVQPEVEVEVDIQRKPDTAAIEFSIHLAMSLGEHEIEKELSFSPAIDAAETITAAADQHDWCAWLGIPESPFFDAAFVEEYTEDRASTALLQTYIKDPKIADEIKSAVEELIKGNE